MIELGETVNRDFIGLFCGDRLGGGLGRDVYVLATDPSKVIKIEQAGGSFQNVIEWETWLALSATKHAKWLAPCHHISGSGSVLIMTRVEPLAREAERRRIPAWLCDRKRENYGMLNGQLVCCDYGTNLLLNHGAFGAKLERPKWWDLTKSGRAPALKN